MDVLSALASFAVVAGLLTLVPGLDTALVVRATVLGGRRAGAAAALGVAAGCLVWGVAAAVGVATLLSVSSAAGTVLRAAGAAYLLWVGGRLVVTAVRRRGDAAAAGPEVPAPPVAALPGGAPGAFRRGLVTNVLNPKIGAFYLAVLPQFLPDGVPPAVMGVLLALVHGAEGLAWFAVVVVAVARVRALLARPAVTRALDGVTGAVLVAFGAVLAREAV